MCYTQNRLIASLSHALHRFAFVVVLLGALAACAALIPHQYLITQQTLQNKLQDSFPIQHELGNGMFRATLETPILELDVAHNRVAISSEFSAYTILSGPVHGTLKMSSALRFDAEQRAIFLHEPVFESLSFTQDAHYADLLRPAMNMMLVETLREHPLYRFQADELRYAGTDIDITSIDVVPAGISLKLSRKRPSP